MSYPQEKMGINPIGIFDSGIGGLTVVKAIMQQMPEETLCYFGDTARMPYGTKSAETVSRYSVEITRFLKSHDAKIIVVACNTASSVAIQSIESTFEGPVISVVDPGVNAALRVTNNGQIGIIGTKSTIQSGTYQKRLLKADPHLQITAHPCPLFVPLAEEGWENDPITHVIAKRYLQPFIENKVDVLILGCTHFPLLSETIQNVLGDSVVLVNSAEEVSKMVGKTLEDLKLKDTVKYYKNLFYASDDIEGFKRLYNRICGKQKGTFMEATSDFFHIVQEVNRFKGKIFADTIQWFETLNGE